jgi:hypothetical protein
MIGFPLALLLAAPAPAPAAFTPEHNRAIGCVAFIGVAAARQRQGITGSDLPDVSKDGARWAGIVGARIMDETGLPREVVGFAIQEAVPAAQRIFQLHNPEPALTKRKAECLPMMQADLAAATLDAPLPIPTGR